MEHIHDGRVHDGPVVSIVDLWSIHDGRVRSMQA